MTKEETMEYRSKRSRFSNEEAQAIGEALAKLGPGYTPQDVVDAARDPDSPLHSYFTWSVEQAAEKCWLHEARYLIQSITLRCVGEDEQESEIRAFQSVVVAGEEDDEPAKHVFVPIQSIAKNPAAQEQVIARLVDELARLKAKLQAHKDFFGGVIHAIEQAQAEVVRPRAIPVRAKDLRESA